MRRCIGCGRLRGGLGAMACPCWRAVKRGATVPYRIRSWRNRIEAAYTAVSRASTDADRAAAEAVCVVLNRKLEVA
jgi:hypothetical protein